MKDSGPLDNTAVLKVAIEQFADFLQIPVGVDIVEIRFDLDDSEVTLTLRHPLLQGGEVYPTYFVDKAGQTRTDWSTAILHGQKT